MPHAHRAHAEWTPSRLIAWAAKTGPATAQVVADILASRPHPEQDYRACLGVLRLGKRYGAARLDAACVRAVHLGAPRYQTVQNILTTGLDQVPLDEPAAAPVIPVHANLRGAAYYADHPPAGAAASGESGDIARGGR